MWAIGISRIFTATLFLHHSKETKQIFYCTLKTCSWDMFSENISLRFKVKGIAELCWLKLTTTVGNLSHYSVFYGLSKVFFDGLLKEKSLQGAVLKPCVQCQIMHYSKEQGLLWPLDCSIPLILCNLHFLEKRGNFWAFLALKSCKICTSPKTNLQCSLLAFIPRIWFVCTFRVKGAPPKFCSYSLSGNEHISN